MVQVPLTTSLDYLRDTLEQKVKIYERQYQEKVEEVCEILKTQRDTIEDLETVKAAIEYVKGEKGGETLGP
jgi:hypothetical protein